MALIFEWDRAKAESNLLKHGVSFGEAATVFGDPLSLTIEDADHRGGRRRQLTLGTSARQRLLLVVHSERHDTIRIISARRATRRERISYEEEI